MEAPRREETNIARPERSYGRPPSSHVEAEIQTARLRIFLSGEWPGRHVPDTKSFATKDWGQSAKSGIRAPAALQDLHFAENDTFCDRLTSATMSGRYLFLGDRRSAVEILVDSGRKHGDHVFRGQEIG